MAFGMGLFLGELIKLIPVIIISYILGILSLSIQQGHIPGRTPSWLPLASVLGPLAVMWSLPLATPILVFTGGQSLMSRSPGQVLFSPVFQDHGLIMFLVFGAV